MNEREEYETLLGEVQRTIASMNELDISDKFEFVKAVAMLATCFTNRKNHAVLLMIENEDTLKVMGVNASSWDAALITANAADMFVSAKLAAELNRKGETH